jgi:hypothetical protein
MSAARSAVERAGAYGHAAVQALVLDDWKALTDAHSSFAQRVEGGVGLASWAIPEGKIAEIAGHATAKAVELAAAHMTVSGLEHASASAAAIAASRTLSRPLTEAERSGHFESANDFKRFMGPATERGGPERDWHHVVEKAHADGTGQFPPGRVHSVENIVPVARETHQGKSGLTSEFNTKDEFLGTSLRDRLAGQPWEKHVDNGEQALRDRGLDPNVLRAETQTRFQQRLLEHDRGASIEHDRSQIVAPGLVLSANQTINRETPAEHRDGSVHWSPDMSHEDFAKLQARVRGGSPARATETGLHLERDGRQESLPPGRRIEGTIRAVDGDQIVQHVGQNKTAVWSREELAGHFSDAKAFEAMVQPGHYLQIGADRNGVVDVRQQLQDRSWQSLGNQPVPHQSLGHDLGR